MTTVADELISVISGQHGRIKALMTRVATSSGADRSGAFAQFRRLVAVHEAAEQTLLHPQGVTRLTDVDVSEERITEEEAAGAIITQLEHLDGPDFTVQFGLLQSAVLRHAEAEEREELPLLVDALPDRTVDQVLEGFALVEPWVDDVASPIADGPFEQMLRDSMVAFASTAEVRP